MDSSAAKMTLQGMAIQQAAIDFGNGQTLPFTPCKRGYIPMVNGQRMYACSFHDKARAKRLAKENEVFRDGEVDLNVFWNPKEQVDSEHMEDKVEKEEEEKKEDLKDCKGT
mmetsp:Transcript_27887/g.67851  ORF Transcript_27887/g.67851 Transcript_27887/m.67851 type:complete len:111 (+) Transcript_27887:356-688(+)